jgi:hypothetical protein
MYYVIRPPSVLEDEGRSFLEYTAKLEHEALDWIDRQVDNSRGYYKHSSFIIARPQHDF